MSLKRVLEPEVMESLEDAQDYDLMDHSEVNRLFAEELIALKPSLGDVLDVGTGTAQIPVAICQLDPDCRIMASDQSANMLDLGVYNVEMAGFIERIQLSQDDAKNMPFEDEMFDTVISNSIIHHLPDPILCLKEVVRVCRTGGLIFFRDLLRPETDEQVSSLVQTYAGQENQNQQKMFDDSLRAALSLEETRDSISSLGFDRETVQATSDRHWTWTTIKQ